MVARGTTPKLIFTVNSEIDLEQIEEIWITTQIIQKNAARKERTYTKSACEINYSLRTIECMLTQKDTLDMNDNLCYIQLRIKMNDGTAYASEIYEEQVGKVLNGGVI